MRSTCLMLVTSLTVCAGVRPQRADASPFAFSKVIDTSAFAPGTGWRFTSFHNVAISGDNVAFLGNTEGAGARLTARIDGTFVNITTSVPVPGGVGNLISLSPPVIDGVTVAFVGEYDTPSGIWRGIYAGSGGPLVTLADRATPIPGSGGNFHHFGGQSLRLRQGRLAFLGRAADGNEGIYRRGHNGVLERVIDATMSVPGASLAFSGFGEESVSFDGEHVAFTGFAPPTAGALRQGVYTTLDAGADSVRAVANLGTPIPDGGGNFTSVGNWTGIVGGDVLFDGYNSPNQPPQRGIFRDPAGSAPILTVVGRETLLPGSHDLTFFAPSELEVDGDRFIFHDTGSGLLAYYLYDAGQLHQVVRVGDVIDGRVVSGLGQAALSGDNVAVELSFSAADKAIYIATIPEPTTAAFAGASAALLLLRRRVAARRPAL